jgi:hypothetical protein
MAKKKKRGISREESAELDARYEKTTRLLQDRIDYHTAKLAEEKAQRGEKPA